MTASATVIFHSRQVRYKDDKSVENAINDLYEKYYQSSKYMNDIGCDGCTKLEYLESTGTQYIDTGIFVDDSYGFLIKTRSLSKDDRVAIGVNGTGNSRWCYNPMGYKINISWNGIFEVFPEDTSLIFTAKVNYLNDRKIIFNNSLVTNISQVLNASASNYEVPLFGARWNSNNVVYKYIGRIYNVKISKGKDIIIDFIPALDKDKRPCMFDKVSKMYFYNQGTGEFLYG